MAEHSIIDYDMHRHIQKEDVHCNQAEHIECTAQPCLLRSRRVMVRAAKNERHHSWRRVSDSGWPVNEEVQPDWQRGRLRRVVADHRTTRTASRGIINKRARVAESEDATSQLQPLTLLA